MTRYNPKITAAIRRLANIEPLGSDELLSAVSDDDLTTVRNRLWVLLGRLDDGADRRGTVETPQDEPERPDPVAYREMLKEQSKKGLLEWINRERPPIVREQSNKLLSPAESNRAFFISIGAIKG